MAVASLYLGVSPLAAQQTKGNIVEYFGKERVERVDEGRYCTLSGRGISCR